MTAHTLRLVLRFVIQSEAKNPFPVPLGGRPSYPPMRAALLAVFFQGASGTLVGIVGLRPIQSRVLVAFCRQKVNRKTATEPTRWTRRLGASPPVPRCLTVYAHEGLPPTAAWIRAVCAAAGLRAGTRHGAAVLGASNVGPLRGQQPHERFCEAKWRA